MKPKLMACDDGMPLSLGGGSGVAQFILVLVVVVVAVVEVVVAVVSNWTTGRDCFNTFFNTLLKMPLAMAPMKKATMKASR